MFLQDALEARRSDPAVPHAFGVNDNPWSSDADPEALRFRPHRAQPRFFHPAFDVFPHDLRFRARAAVRTHAEEEVAVCGGDAGFRQAYSKWVNWHARLD